MCAWNECVGIDTPGIISFLCTEMSVLSSAKTLINGERKSFESIVFHIAVAIDSSMSLAVVSELYVAVCEWQSLSTYQQFSIFNKLIILPYLCMGRSSLASQYTQWKATIIADSLSERAAFETTSIKSADLGMTDS